MLDQWMTWAQSGTMIRRFSAGLALVLALSVATAAGSSSRTAAFPGKNGRILIPAGQDLGTNTERDRGVYTITARGIRLRQLLKEPVSDVRWSPDGREILFSSRCGITFATATGTNRTCLGVDGSDLSWSYDGSRIVLEKNLPGGAPTLQILTRDGYRLMTLPIKVGFPSNLAWSPLGTRIAFDLGNDVYNEKPGIYAISQDGTAVKRLTTTDDNQPNWSPDGKRIVFVRRGYELWIMDADGTNEHKLLVVQRGRGAPDDATASAVWSPDGTKIAFASPGARSISIYTLRTRTRRTIRLHLPPGVEVNWNERLDWQPIRRQ
jgi:Tol biopolymer transport system component